MMLKSSRQGVATCAHRWRFIAHWWLGGAIAAGCSSSERDGCESDNDCAPDRICEGRSCVAPAQEPSLLTSLGVEPTPVGRREGTACDTSGAVVCSQDDQSRSFSCQDGVLVDFFDCPGLQRCQPVEGRDSIVCGEGGTHYARAGDPCASDRSRACSFDKSAILFCERGSWLEAQHCPPSECVAEAGQIGCANGGISIGDVCRSAVGSVTCSTDLRNILACRDGIAVVSQSCGDGRCTLVDANTLACRF